MSANTAGIADDAFEEIGKGASTESGAVGTGALPAARLSTDDVFTIAPSQPQQLAGPMAVSSSIGGAQQLAHNAAAGAARTARTIRTEMTDRRIRMRKAGAAVPYSLVSLRYEARCRKASLGRPSFSASVAALK